MEVLLILRVLLMLLKQQNVVGAVDELNCSEILVVRVEVDSFFFFLCLFF